MLEKARFAAPVQNGPEAQLYSHTMGTGSFPGLKRPGRGANHSPPSNAGVKATVNALFYFSLNLHDLIYGELCLNIYGVYFSSQRLLFGRSWFQSRIQSSTILWFIADLLRLSIYRRLDENTTRTFLSHFTINATKLKLLTNPMSKTYFDVLKP
jgi:hypothetical protein